MDEMKRNSNFSEEEIDLLLCLVEERKDIIQCKKTDKVNAEKKAASWKAIEASFNAGQTKFRSHKVLKKKYLNLRMEAKKKAADNKRQLKVKWTDEKSKIEVEILKVEHEQKITFMAELHQAAMEKARLEVDLLRFEIEVKEKAYEKLNLEVELLKAEHKQKMTFMAEQHQAAMEKVKLEMELLDYKIKAKEEMLE